MRRGRKPIPAAHDFRATPPRHQLLGQMANAAAARRRTLLGLAESWRGLVRLLCRRVAISLVGRRKDLQMSSRSTVGPKSPSLRRLRRMDSSHAASRREARICCHLSAADARMAESQSFVRPRERDHVFSPSGEELLVLYQNGHARYDGDECRCPSFRGEVDLAPGPSETSTNRPSSRQYVA